MSALFNFDKNKLERFEDQVFSLGSVVGQILFPIGMISLLLLPYTTTIIFAGNFEFSIGYMVCSLMFTLLGLGATATASLDQNTIWHRLNKKFGWFGYKW